MSEPLLSVDGVEVKYGAVTALHDVSLAVSTGEVVTLLGANGAGKTTTLRTISGLLSPAVGQVTYEGEALTGLPAHSIVALGIGHVPEGRHIFGRMTVTENLEMGAYLQKRGAPSELDRVLTLFPRLAERRTQLGATLSGGEQQMLAIGRALMGRPKLLLLDEPSMGLSPLMVQTIFEVISMISAEGVTVLLVEQNAVQALSLASRGYVMETGRIVMADAAKTLLADDRVRQAYLGEDMVASQERCNS